MAKSLGSARPPSDLLYLRVKMNLKMLLRQKNERLIRSNKDWLRYKEEKRIVIEDFRKKNEDLRRKNEDKKYEIEELRAKYNAEKIVADALRKSNDRKEFEKLKNELGILNDKCESALNEIDKLARLINVYGKTSSVALV